MKDRIRQVMESKHMTQQVFADYIGIAAATLSSVFNGRTRPTINIVEAIKKKIPNISTDWLMFGLGDMFISESAGADFADASQNQLVFESGDSHQYHSPMLDFDTPVSPTTQNGFSTIQNQNSVRSTRPEIVREEIKLIDKPQKKIMEIRVFYDDQTYDTFVPAKK